MRPQPAQAGREHPRVGAGNARARLLGYLLSSMLLGVGYLMVGFTERNAACTT